MDNIFNWDDVQETSYINQEGTYTLKIIDAAKDDEGNVTQTSANGKPFHRYICETQDHEKISVSLYLIENAMWKYKAFVKACGLEAKGGVDLTTLPFKLIGRKFIGEVKKQPARQNVVTGVVEESKYYEVVKFLPIEG